MRASSTHTSAMICRMRGTLQLLAPRISELLLRGGGERGRERRRRRSRRREGEREREEE